MLAVESGWCNGGCILSKDMDGENDCSSWTVVASSLFPCILSMSVSTSSPSSSNISATVRILASSFFRLAAASCICLVTDESSLPVQGILCFEHRLQLSSGLE